MERCAEPGASMALGGKLPDALAGGGNTDAAKAPGTGVFMPLTTRTVGSNEGNDRSHNRSKPNRRRNLTSPSIVPICHTDREPARRSISSSNLATRRRNPPSSRNSMSSLEACIERECAADDVPLADVSVAMHAAAGITASAHPAFSETAAALIPVAPVNRVATSPHWASMGMQSSSPSGLSPPEQVLLSITVQGQQQVTRQHTQPGHLPLLAGSSSSINNCSSNTGSSCMASDGNPDSVALLNARFDAAAGHHGVCGTASTRGGAPISNEAMHTFCGPPALQSVGLAGGLGDSLTPVNSTTDLGTVLPPPLRSSSRQSPDVGTRAAFTQQPCSPGSAAISPSALAGSADMQALGGGKIYSQLSFNNWTALQAPSGLHGSDSIESTSAADVATSAADLEQHEQQIQKRIDELLVMKQLVKLKQQHKQQQMQLQMQQLHQEQQMLASLQSMKDESPFEVQRSAASWTACTSGIATADGKTTLQAVRQQQHLLQVQRSGNSLEQLQREVLQQQLQQQQQQQQQDVVQSASGTFINQIGLAQQDMLQQLQVERSQGSFGNTVSQELQQLRQLQQELMVQQLPMQHSACSAGSLVGTNGSMLMLQPALSAPAPCSDGVLGFGTRPGPSANSLVNAMNGISLNSQSFDGALPLFTGDCLMPMMAGNVDGNRAACNMMLGVVPGNGQLALTTGRDAGSGGGGGASTMASISAAARSRVQGAAQGTTNGQMGNSSRGGGMSGFQLF